MVIRPFTNLQLLEDVVDLAVHFQLLDAVLQVGQVGLDFQVGGRQEFVGQEVLDLLLRDHLGALPLGEPLWTKTFVSDKTSRIFILKNSQKKLSRKNSHSLTLEQVQFENAKFNPFCTTKTLIII